jgi:PAS domain S-box-containing protein
LDPRQQSQGADPLNPRDLERLFPGDSELACRMRGLDWSKTDLGPPQNWPANLLTAVSLCLTSRIPVVIYWGPSFTVLYNDAYIAFLGETMHPLSLGQPARDCRREIWRTIGPMLESVYATGQATGSEDLQLFFARALPLEEVYVRFTFGPILARDGRTVDGIFCPCTEATEQVVGARRLETLRKLGAKPAEARSIEAAGACAAEVLGENPHDIPFVALYLVDETGAKARLSASAGLDEGIHPLPASVSLSDGNPSPWPLAAVMRTFRTEEIAELDSLVAPIRGRIYPEPVRQAIVLPIPSAAHDRLAGLLVVGVSPRRVLDAAYRTFFALVAGQIGTAIANARAYEAEHERAEALAELDPLRQEVNAAIWQNREWLRVTLASIGDGAITSDTQGQITYLNPVAESLTGWRNDEAVGQALDAVFRIVDEQTRRPVENPALRALREGVVVGLGRHTLLVQKDGTERPIDDRAAPILDEHGHPVGCVLIFRDVTDQRQAAERLRASEERFRSLTDAITSVVWTSDAEGRFVIPQASWSEFTGQTWEEVRDFGWEDAMHPDDRERVRELAAAARASKTLFKANVRLWHVPSGSYRHCEARGVPIFDPDGSVREWVGTCLDVEDRTRAMEEIARQWEDLQSLIMQSPVPICVLQGPDLVYEMANAAFLELVGGRDLLGKPLLDALPEIGGQGYDEVLRGVMRGGEPVVGRDARIVLEREGRLQEAYWTFIFSPLRDADGAVNRVVALCDDVTEQRRLMIELIDADRRKDEFLATLAHELRNPLAPLRNSVQLLRRQDPPSPEIQRAIDVIDRQVQQMVRLVDDLLDISRITLDKLELRKERVTLAMVVHAAVEASRPLIEQWGHELTVTLPPEAVELDADLTRLAQVFLNLLNNAAKYTGPGGRIGLAAEREGETVIVRVTDSGVGIAAEMLPRVFEMFLQVDRSLDRSQGGLGIGLTLVKRLVEMHGGSIEARSEGPDKGSEFVVRLPVANVGSPGAGPSNRGAAEPARSARQRILVVDDNRDAAETLSALLEITGNEVRIAHDGLEAVQLAGECRPDVVLLDIGLPKLNGYEVAQKIREEPWGKGTVLVALTGWGQEEDRRRSQEAGFDHHMVKPVEPEALLRLLTSLADGRSPAE